MPSDDDDDDNKDRAKRDENNFPDTSTGERPAGGLTNKFRRMDRVLIQRARATRRRHGYCHLAWPETQPDG